MIALTETAAAKDKELLQTSIWEGDALRVRVKAGGWSDLRYGLAFDSQAAVLHVHGGEEKRLEVARGASRTTRRRPPASTRRSTI